MGEAEISKGLEGVLAAESKICLIDGEAGKLLYRGYNINDLAPNTSFEEVTYLLLYGKLPMKAELKEFKKRLAVERVLPKELMKLMKVFAKNSKPMEALRTSVSLLSAFDSNSDELSPEKVLEKSIKLTALFPTIVTSAYMISKGKKPIKPKKSLSHAANFLYMLHGTVPDETSARAMDMDFILHAEHGFNASTFASRVTISTLSDYYSSIVSGIGTLKGPLHGGAAEEVYDMLEKIGSADKAEAFVKNALEKKEKIMGFGHRVYKTFDPRAVQLKKMAKELAEKAGDTKFYNISEKIEAIVVPLLQAKKIYPNVDFYSATVYHSLKIPEELFTTIFAIARISGWSAHVMEQLADNRLIRPREKYTGGVDLPFVPINKRKE